MRAFLARFAGVVRGVLSGFDRLFLRGTLRGLAHTKGVRDYLWANQILHKDFATHLQAVTARLEEASLREANRLGREVRYLNSSAVRKEDVAREIAERDRIRSGLICVLRSVDPCMTFRVGKNKATKKLEVRHCRSKCLHLYHYQVHPVFGFMHARIQTWFPFTVYVCLNGREWLARQMDQAGLHYQRRDNTFTWLEDVERTQALFDQQLQANWPGLLAGLAEALNPAHPELFAKAPCRYYWSVQDSEWASDVAFASRHALQEVYPQLIRHAITTFGAADVLRFLGQPVPASGKVPHRRRHEVTTNLKERVEGVRIKHWLNRNSVKLYDKGPVLRAECMVRQPEDFKVYRPAEGEPDGAKAWRPLRHGIADLHRRAEVSQAANERYLDALAAVHDTTPVRELAGPLCRPVAEPARRRDDTVPKASVGDVAERQGPAGGALDGPAQPSGTGEAAPPGIDNAAPGAGPQATGPSATAGSASVTAGLVAAVVVSGAALAAPEPPGCCAKRECGAAGTPRSTKDRRAASAARRRVRALNPLGAADAALLEAVSRHEFLINGLRNRDLRRLLYRAEAPEQRRQAAAVTRQLRLLRAHGLIHKVPRTHRYVVSEAGRRAITAVLAARNSCADELIRCAG